jgi:hypothetical protein
LTERLFTSRESVWLVMGGRLKPGVTLAQAHSELDSIAMVAPPPRSYAACCSGSARSILLGSEAPRCLLARSHWRPDIFPRAAPRTWIR